MLERVYTTAYFCLLLLAAVAAYRTTDRDWNWDGLAYMACAVSWSEPDPVKLHAMVYREARAQMPAPAYQALAAGNPYRSDLAGNPFHFAEQLPFYDSRTLYIGLIVLLRRLGMSYISAMKLLSAAGFAALGLIFFRWVRKYFRALPAAILSAAIMLSTPVWGLARIFSPDALAAAMILGALYALFVAAPARPLNQRSPAACLGLALLGTSEFLRRETPLLAVLVIAYLTMASRSPVKLKRLHGVLLIAALIVTMLALGYFGGGYGWRMTLYHGLVQRVPAPADAPAPAITVKDYLHATLRSAREAVTWSSLPLFVFLTASCLLVLKRGTLMRDLLILSLSSAAILFLVYPSFEERYYVSAYLVVALCLISALAERRAGSKLYRRAFGERLLE